jgi:surface antigen
VLAVAGMDPTDAGRYGNCGPWVRWLRKHGRWGSRPRTGAIVFYDWDGDDLPEHVGLVEQVRADGRIVTIEGNATVPGRRDGVYRMVRRACILGFGYPPYAQTALPEPVGPLGARPGYPTLVRGFGGPEDATGTQRWWVGQWYRSMGRYSPGYFKRVATDPRGAAEIARLEIGDGTLSVVRDMARQAFGETLQWRGAITPAIWGIYPPVK